MTDGVVDEIEVGQLGPLQQIGAGDQAVVFEVLDDPDRLVYKEYSPDVRDDVDVDVLRRFVAFTQSLDESDRRQLMERAAWPVTIVRRDGVVSGFLMSRVPSEFTAQVNGSDGPEIVPARTRYLFQDKSKLRDRRWIDDRFRLEFLRDTAETLALFHRLGIAVGGDWLDHLLFSQRVRPRCYFIACDAMRLGEDTVLNRRSDALGDGQAIDSYELGLLALRLFTGDQNAYDPERVSALPPRLRRPATESLRTDAAERPDVRDWLEPLDIALSQPPRISIPEPAPARVPPPPRRRGKPAWLTGVSLVIGLITLIIRLSNSGTTTVTIPDYNDYPWPTPAFGDSFLLDTPDLTTSPETPASSCGLVTIVLADPSDPEQTGVLATMHDYLCGVATGSYSSAGGPSDAQSRTNFNALISDVADALSFEMTVSSAHAVNATTVNVATSIDADSQCWTMTFVLNKQTAAYSISSIGAPAATQCG